MPQTWSCTKVGGEQGRSPCQLLRGRGASPPLIQPRPPLQCLPRPVPGQTPQHAAALPGGAASVHVPLRLRWGLGAEGAPRLFTPALQAWVGLLSPAHPIRPGKTRTPEIHKTGWPQELETQETPVRFSGPSSLGGCVGQTPPPINICNPPTCSLLPKLLPKCLFQAPESACGTGGVVGGPWFLRVFIIQVYICKKIFFKYMCLFTTSQAVCSSGLQGK